MRTGVPALLTTCLLAGCPPASGPVASFEPTGPILPASTGGTTDGTGGGEADTSTGPPAEDSTASSGATVPLRDLGGAPDLGTLEPPGCAGKIDLLFVVSSHYVMQTVQGKLIDAFADFHATIAARFADFDFHIMVVDGDNDWGLSFCNEGDCAAQTCQVPDYPCELLGTLTACDKTWGAGHVSNAGYNAANKDCGVVDGRRYLTRAQPDLAETFACVAQVGTSGSDALGIAVTEAVSPEMNGPGGCNEGFLRDDALLMVTFLMGGHDGWSPGTPDEWAQTILDAKHGDPGSVVMFGFFAPNCVDDQADRLCQMVQKFPYWQVESNLVDDYGPAFADATELVAAACSDFIPK